MMLDIIKVLRREIWLLLMFVLKLCLGLTVMVSLVFGEATFCACPGVKPWAVDNSFSGERFQRLLVARQNDCEHKVIWDIVINSAGVGATMAHTVRMMGEAFSMNAILRPNDKSPYLWGAEHAANCSLPLRAVDCYHMPLSYCGFIHNVKVSPDHIQSNWSGTDICELGQLTRRSLQWINEQMFVYVLRQREDVQLKILENVEPFFRVARSHGEFLGSNRTAGSLSVQLRTGNGDVLDAGRVFEPTMDSYMDAIDKMAERMLEHDNKVLTVVYLASNNPEKTYISAEHMSKTYPRSFRFYELPHIHLGTGDPLRAHRNNVNGVAHKYTNLDLHNEFYTDIYVYSHTDYFIGSSTSFVYKCASLLRSSYGLKKSSTCLVSFSSQENKLQCEDEATHYETLYKDMFGYQGGTMFA